MEKIILMESNWFCRNLQQTAIRSWGLTRQELMSCENMDALEKLFAEHEVSGLYLSPMMCEEDRAVEFIEKIKPEFGGKPIVVSCFPCRLYDFKLAGATHCCDAFDAVTACQYLVYKWSTRLVYVTWKTIDEQIAYNKKAPDDFLSKMNKIRELLEKIEQPVVV